MYVINSPLSEKRQWGKKNKPSAYKYGRNIKLLTCTFFFFQIKIGKLQKILSYWKRNPPGCIQHVPYKEK